jgi:hypothetical protein
MAAAFPALDAFEWQRTTPFLYHQIQRRIHLSYPSSGFTFTPRQRSSYNLHLAMVVWCPVWTR